LLTTLLENRIIYKLASNNGIVQHDFCCCIAPLSRHKHWGASEVLWLDTQAISNTALVGNVPINFSQAINVLINKAFEPRQDALRGSLHPGNGSPAKRPEILRKMILTLLGIALAISLIMNGAVASPWRQSAMLLLALPLLLTLGVRFSNRETQRLVRLTASLLGLVVAWGIFQTMPLPFGWAGHPGWETLRDLQLYDKRHISVAPSQTRAAITSLILPFLVFAAMLLLCQRRDDAFFAWVMLTYVGVSVALLSIMLEIFFPDAQVFSNFAVGRGGFNGVFVNRNTSAAVFGLTAFALAALMMVRPEKTPHAGYPNRAALPETLRGPQKIALALALFMVVICIILTRSRAGTIFSLLFLTLSFILCVTLYTERNKSKTRQLSVRTKLIIVTLTGFGVFLFFGEPVLSRLGNTAQDGRWCAWDATLKAIVAHPWTGTGFGTFAEVFPQYRDADCLGSDGVWLRAHNSYLEFIAGFGALGAVVILASAGLCGATLLRGIGKRKSLQSIPLFALGALAFMAMHSAFDFPLQIPGVAVYFAAIMGAACAISILERRGARRR
jgi:O-antigen ligase